MKITASRWDYIQAHSDELISTRIVPVAPYNQQDIHDQFQQVLDTITDFGRALIRDGHLTADEFLDKTFKYNPIKQRVKGQALRQRVRFVGRRDRLVHREGHAYSVQELIEMIQQKVNSTLPGTKDLAHFTEAQLMRVNRSLKWFSLLADKYYGEGSHWSQHLPTFKIKIEWYNNG